MHHALGSRLALTPGATPTQLADFYVPARHAATFPWVSHALWFYEQMVRWHQVEFSATDVAAVRSTYRPDLYRAALTSRTAEIPATDMKTERFFDGQTFDAAELTG